MRRVLRAVPLVLLLALLPLPAAAAGFAISLPADSAVTIDSPSLLVFRVTNTGAGEGLSRLALRFPTGYRLTNGSAPSGWTADLSTGGEISFGTSDDAKCTGAIAPGSSLVFGVEVIAPASSTVSPDSLLSAQGEQSCRGVVLDPPATLPSWDRLGIEAALAAGPPILGMGGTVTVTMTVTNRSTVDLADISPLLTPTGTGGLSGVAGPTPANLTLAPGASGSMIWTARAASAGTVSFSGQAVGKSVTSPPVRSDTLYVADLDVSLSVTPEQVVSGQDVQVQMTVTNRGPIRVTNVTPSSLAFEGTAVLSAAAGPSPATLPVLEPGQSATLAWAATVTGLGGETYAFSGWASAEWDAVVSAKAISNRGTLAQPTIASGSDTPDGSSTFVGGVGSGGSAATASTATTTTTSPTTSAPASGGGGASVPSTGSSVPPAVPSATLQLVGVNQNGSLTGGAVFSTGLLRDLRLIVGWTSLSGSHTQRLEFFSPDGSLYQRLSTQFASTSVQTQLAVGGTWITEYSLFGAWRVEVYLDRERMPITSGVFVLTP